MSFTRESELFFSLGNGYDLQINQNDCLHLKFRVQEGYLTELHLVALLTPCQELVDICRALLSYGADPDLETSTEFNPNGDREILLDARQGRTPIHLLCMRPDMNYADPEGVSVL